jgi:hypothetical protein
LRSCARRPALAQSPSWSGRGRRFEPLSPTFGSAPAQTAGILPGWREHIHDLPVIYMSGDSAADWSSKGVPNSVIVAKPFVAAQIVTAVATLMTKTDTDRAH